MKNDQSARKRSRTLLQATPVAAAVAAMLCTSGLAQAQTTPAGVTDTVVITGIRRGIESAISVKKNADCVVEAISAGSPLSVRLSNGQTVAADLVISATGVKPAISFLENAGVTCLMGVLTDEHLQTNVPGVYAAGDCAEAFDKVSGKTIVSAIQPNAAE